MGFWSNLGKIASVAAPIAGIPFTGGASALGLTGKLGGILGGVGAAASGMAQDEGDERETGVRYNLLRDELGMRGERDYQDNVTDRARLDMERKKYADAARQDAAKEAFRSSAVQSFKMPERPRGIPNISFTSGVNAQGKGAADELGKQAMLRLLTGTKFDELPELQRYQMTSPEEMPEAGTMEKLMGILGLGATGVAGAMKKPPAMQLPGSVVNVPRVNLPR